MAGDRPVDAWVRFPGGKRWHQAAYNAERGGYIAACKDRLLPADGEVNDHRWRPDRFEACRNRVCRREAQP